MGTARAFMMGIVAGVGCAVVYSLGRNRKLGDKVADRIETFEGKAIDLRDRVTDAVSSAGHAVAERIGSAGQAVADRFGTQETELESGSKTGGASSSRGRKAG